MLALGFAALGDAGVRPLIQERPGFRMTAA